MALVTPRPRVVSARVAPSEAETTRGATSAPAGDDAGSLAAVPLRHGRGETQSPRPGGFAGDRAGGSVGRTHRSDQAGLRKVPGVRLGVTHQSRRSRERTHPPPSELVADGAENRRLRSPA